MSNTKELGITKGECTSHQGIDKTCYVATNRHVIASMTIWSKKNDAKVMAEAINIANQTGLTPKQLLDKVELLENMIVDSQQQISLTLKENQQLLEQRDELLKCCQNFVDKVESGKARSKKSYSEMKKAIKSITDK